MRGRTGRVAFKSDYESMSRRLSARADADLLATDVRAVSHERHVDGKTPFNTCRSKFDKKYECGWEDLL